MMATTLWKLDSKEKNHVEVNFPKVLAEKFQVQLHVDNDSNSQPLNIIILIACTLSIRNVIA
jgi:hypothetical protein